MTTAAPHTFAPEPGSLTRRGRSRPGRFDRPGAWLLVAASVVGGALAGAEPAGHPAADLVLSGAFSATVALAASTSRRWTWLVAGGVSVVVADGWPLVLGATAAMIAFGAALADARTRMLGAACGALAVQAHLRLPEVGFHGGSSLLAAAAVTPLLISGYLLARPHHRRRILLGLPVLALLSLASVAALAVAVERGRGPVERGIEQARAGLEATRDGDSETATRQLEAAAEAFGEAHDVLDAWWARPARAVPIVGQHAAALVTATAEATTVAHIASQASRLADVEQLRVDAGRLDLDRVARLEPHLALLTETLTEADTRLAAVSTPWLLGPLADRLDQLRQEVAAARPEAEVALVGARTVPALFGGEGPRRYFIIFATPSEARELGGLMGNWGVLEAVDGKVALSRIGRSADLNLAPGPRFLADPRRFPQGYLAYYRPTTFIQNITGDIDIGIVAAAASELFPQAGGTPIDGIIYADPIGLAALIELTGPVPVPELGRTLTAADTAEFLLLGQYIEFPDRAERIDALESVGRATFEQLTAAPRLPGPRRTAEVLGPAVRGGHLALHTFHEGDQDFLGRIGAARRLPKPDGTDFVAVTNSNANANKVDVFLRREIDYRVEFDPVTGDATATLTVSLHNDAPADGLPPIVIEAGPDIEVPPGANRTLLSTYTELDVRSVRVDGRTVRPELRIEHDRLRSLLSVIVPQGGTTVVEYDLAGRLSPGHIYQLTYFPQALADADELDVVVGPAPGWIPVEEPSPRADERHRLVAMEASEHGSAARLEVEQIVVFRQLFRRH
jgi:hypothetical protein